MRTIYAQLEMRHLKLSIYSVWNVEISAVYGVFYKKIPYISYQNDNLLSTYTKVGLQLQSFFTKDIQRQGKRPLAFLFYTEKWIKNNDPRSCPTGKHLLQGMYFFYR